MTYLIFGLILLIIVVLVTRRVNDHKAKKNLDQLRANWGKAKTDDFHFYNIRRYADSEKEDQRPPRLTEQTLTDIDFNRLFEFVDRTTSRIGQQFLFKKLIEPNSDPHASSEELIELFSRDEKLREQTQLQLLRLKSADAYYVSSLLHDDLVKKPKWFYLLYLDFILGALLLIMSFKFPVLLVVFIVPVTINTILHYWNKSNTFRYSKAFKQLNVLIGVSSQLLKHDAFKNVSVAEGIAEFKSFQAKTTLIYSDNEGGLQGDLSLIGTYFIELAKGAFLIELFTFFNAIEEVASKQRSIRKLFDYVGNIDTALSIASLRAGALKTCKPVLTADRKEMGVTNVYHPLIRNCVENSLSIRNKSVLITGSNMSGKSTLLRTLVINSILAQTIRTCFADEFISPVVRQFSSVRIDDNLFEGTSYYFEEVKLMASLVAEVGVQQNLFVLDEVFKGTNTIERIAAAKAILSFLNRANNIVVVSTHDIELAEMLKSEYDLYHFTEIVENNELLFDHKLKPGPLRTRNAIKILELCNYPIEITSEAREITGNLMAHRIAER
jgi:hypothetical protein